MLIIIYLFLLVFAISNFISHFLKLWPNNKYLDEDWDTNDSDMRSLRIKPKSFRSKYRNSKMLVMMWVNARFFYKDE